MSDPAVNARAAVAELSDAQLVARTVAYRDHGAYSELVLRHQARVRNWLRQLCGERPQAEDLAQETFLRAWEQLRRLREPDKFGSWSMQIAYREFLQAERRNASRRRLHQAIGQEQTIRPGEPPAGQSEVVDLQRVLASVSAEERAALVLCYAHGFSHSEIAGLLDLPLGTVKSHIARGKARIQKHFDPETDQ